MLVNDLYSVVFSRRVECDIEVWVAHVEFILDNEVTEITSLSQTGLISILKQKGILITA